MNFANWSRMSPRDRMLAGLSGQLMPTHGMQVSTSRGVKLGIAPLAGLGLMNTNTLKTDAAVPSSSITTSQGTFTNPVSNAPIVKTNLLQTRAGSMLSPPSVNAYQKPQGIDTKNRTTDDDSGSSRNTNNSGDYGDGDGEIEDVHAQNPITTVEDARAQNISQTVADAANSAASTGGWPFFDKLPKWVWIAGALGAAWLVFKK